MLTEHAQQSVTRMPRLPPAVGWPGAADLRRSRRRRARRRRTERFHRVAPHRHRDRARSRRRRRHDSGDPSSARAAALEPQAPAGARVPLGGRAARGREDWASRPPATPAPTGTSQWCATSWTPPASAKTRSDAPPRGRATPPPRRTRARPRRAVAHPHELLGQARRDAAHLRDQRVADSRIPRPRAPAAGAHPRGGRAPHRREGRRRPRSTDAARRSTRRPSSVSPARSTASAIRRRPRRSHCTAAPACWCRPCAPTRGRSRAPGAPTRS